MWLCADSHENINLAFPISRGGKKTSNILVNLLQKDYDENAQLRETWFHYIILIIRNQLVYVRQTSEWKSDRPNETPIENIQIYVKLLSLRLRFPLLNYFCCVSLAIHIGIYQFSLFAK